MTRFDRLMRSSLWFRAAYVVVGLLAVVAIHEWILALLDMSHTNPWGWTLLIAMMLIYIWSISGASWRRLPFAIAILPVVTWVQPHLSWREQVIIATAIVIVVAIRHPKQKGLA